MQMTVDENVSENVADGNDDNAAENELPEDVHIPQILEKFDIVKKVGSGTFSSVFLASLKARPEKVFAIKFIVPTTHPSRTSMELSCLIDFGGKDNVLPISTCVRHLDNVAILMPYFPHDEFKSYVGDMCAPELRLYMSSLLQALQRVHAAGVIHRDVKPRNFLYNRASRKFALIDFGLAQKVSEVGNSRPLAKKDKKKSNELHSSTPSPSAGQVGARDPKKPTGTFNDENLTPKPKRMPSKGESAECDCFNKPQVCRKCLKRPSQSACRAGTPGFRPPEVLMKYVQQTTAVDIWAAGVIFITLVSGRYPFFDSADDVTSLRHITRLLGYEALKKAADAIGKSFLCSPEYPTNDLKTLCARIRKSKGQVRRNNSNNSSEADNGNDNNNNNNNNDVVDDGETEIMNVAVNPAGYDDDTEPLVFQSQPTTTTSTPEDDNKNNDSSSTSPARTTFVDLLTDATFDLLGKMLDPNPLTRISAEDALSHPYFSEP